jgi:hypothetical protein
MTSREEIERLLNQTGRTLEGLPSSYTMQEIERRFSGIVGGRTFGDCILHQSDVIELLIGALRDSLGNPIQKPLTLTEANSYQDPMWIEFKVFKEASGWRDGLCDALNWAHRVYRDLNREAEFMVHYRLWRHRPTDEERSAAAWEI